ncbi:MAG: hypothetical protein NC400_01365 [Clostridium sp.]|nr:hypothetical protein [Clostridium sp.]
MKLKHYFHTILAFGLTVIILAFPADCLSFALKGLNLWFERMIPTLFPFMVLSGIIIRMNLTDSFIKLLYPLLGRLFKVRASCVYGMAVGFLCGFPMGAHVAAQLYEQGQISKSEAAFLLSFCNNIGPVYFLSFVLPTLGLPRAAVFLFGMYGLPFFYGLILRYTVFRTAIDTGLQKEFPPKAPLPLLAAMDESILNALLGIARLGGYMIFFNLLMILPTLAAGIFSMDIFKNLPINSAQSALFVGGIGCLMEITGGISVIGNSAPLLVLCVLPFGGASCIAQTYSMIKDTGLSITEYVMHKMILTAATVLYYLAVLQVIA